MALDVFRQRLTFLHPYGGDEVPAAVRDFCRDAQALGHPPDVIRSFVTRQLHAAYWPGEVHAAAHGACDEVLSRAPRLSHV